MVLPDVNVLVYAPRRESSDHERYAAWLTALVGGAEELATADRGFARFAGLRWFDPVRG